jgi:hypothetical protein
VLLQDFPEIILSFFHFRSITSVRRCKGTKTTKHFNFFLSKVFIPDTFKLLNNNYLCIITLKLAESLTIYAYNMKKTFLTFLAIVTCGIAGLAAD